MKHCIILLFIQFILTPGMVVRCQDTVITDIPRITTSVVEISAGRQRYPFAVTHIEMDTITNPPATITSVLNATPGIWMQSGALNTHRISIRGVGNREPFATSKLKVYLDEIPITNGIGESSIEDINPALFQSIEIWRSPASALWGAGHGGMLQLQSHQPLGTTASLELETGSFHRLKADVTGTLLHGKENEWATLINLAHLKDAGYRKNNDYRRQGVTVMQRWHPSSRFQAAFFLHGITLKAFIPSSLGITAFNENPRSAATSWAAVKGNEDYTKWIGGLSWAWNDQNRWTWKGSAFATSFASDEIRPFNVLDESNHTMGFRQRMIYALGTESFISIGLEYLRETYNGSTFETLDPGVAGALLSAEDETRNYLNVFIQGEWSPTRKTRIYAGANVNRTHFQTPDLEHPQSVQLSPVVGGNYTITPDRIDAFASISRGFSPVSIDASRNSDGTINRDLMPETSWNMELGIRVRNKPGTFVFETTLYRLLIDNLVVQKRLAPDIYEANNAGQTVHNGIELSFKSAITRKIQWTTAYTLTDHRFRDFVDGENDFSGNDLTGSAPHTLHNAVVYHTPGFQLRIDQHFISKMPITDDNSVIANASHVVDAAVVLPLSRRNRFGVITSIHVSNLFNTQYASMYQINAQGFGGSEPRYYYPGKARSVYASVKITLDKKS